MEGGVNRVSSKYHDDTVSCLVMFLFICVFVVVCLFVIMVSLCCAFVFLWWCAKISTQINAMVPLDFMWISSIYTESTRSGD